VASPGEHGPSSAHAGGGAASLAIAALGETVQQ
jgi:hypothetical protein